MIKRWSRGWRKVLLAHVKLTSFKPCLVSWLPHNNKNRRWHGRTQACFVSRVGLERGSLSQARPPHHGSFLSASSLALVGGSQNNRLDLNTSSLANRKTFESERPGQKRRVKLFQVSAPLLEHLSLLRESGGTSRGLPGRLKRPRARVWSYVQPWTVPWPVH